MFLSRYPSVGVRALPKANQLSVSGQGSHGGGHFAATLRLGLLELDHSFHNVRCIPFCTMKVTGCQTSYLKTFIDWVM